MGGHDAGSQHQFTGIMPFFDGVGGMGVKFSSFTWDSVYTILLTFLNNLVGQYD
uniref:Uncharacterized protein n=2 Tax=Cyprinus carpio TaxID=7962 RepID=A0A8C1H1J6_CYPCA